jgi:photosystem II stability/assembly factor-like uncharacterized protein
MGDSLFAGTQTGLYLSTDSGAHWSLFALDTDWVSSLAVLEGTLYAATESDGLFQSTDDGVTWSNDTNGLMGSRTTGPIVSAGTNLILSTELGIFVSTDNGLHWQSTIIPTDAIPIAALGTSACVIDSQKDFYYSSDAGITWSLVGPLEGFSYALAFVGTTIINARSSNGGIQRSTDSGHSWPPSNTGLPPLILNFACHSLAFADGNLFMGANRGVFISSDTGGHWIDITDSAQDYAGNSLFAFSLFAWKGRLWVGGYDSIWYRPLSEIEVKDGVPMQSLQPTSVNIYPNPASNIVTIYQRGSSTSELQITDELGNTVARMTSSDSSFSWNCSFYPSGIYECIVKTQTGRQTMPIVVTH